MIAYLDNSATTKPAENVIAAVTGCMRERYYNPSSVYGPAVDVYRELRDTRQLLLGSVHSSGENVYFTSGGTEANNLAILGCVRAMRGRQIIARSAVEHPSVKEAFAPLEREGHEVRIINVDRHGVLQWEELEAFLSEGASFVSCMMVNNETGAVTDTEKLYRLAGGRAIVHVDGVQGYQRVPFHMSHADMFTLSGHKIHAPKGIGALIARKNVQLQPVQFGGGQQSGIRSGTENTPGIAGLRAAVEAMQQMEDMPKKLMQNKLRLLREFRAQVPELVVNGPEPENGAPHIINLSFPGVRGEVLLHALEAEGVYASTGSACSSKKAKVSPVLLAMGTETGIAESALRFSLSPYTTEKEIDYAAEVLGRAYHMLRRYVRR